MPPCDDIVLIVTARYRLRGERVFGNLPAALKSDLRLATGTPAPYGDLRLPGAGLAVDDLAGKAPWLDLEWPSGPVDREWVLALVEVASEAP